jgi:hypothetical protein
MKPSVINQYLPLVTFRETTVKKKGKYSIGHARKVNDTERD